MATAPQPPIDFLLDPLTNDLDVSGGQLHFSTGLQAIAQGCRIRVQMIQGEWFLDQSLGVPYFKSATVASKDALLGQKPFDPIKSAAAFRAILEAVPGVTQVILSTVAFDSKTRKATLKWQVRSEFGDTSPEELVTP